MHLILPKDEPTIAESQTLLGQLVDAWRANLTAVAAEIRVSQVIGHYDEHIGLFLL